MYQWGQETHACTSGGKGEANSGLRARVYLGLFVGEKGFVDEREGQMLYPAYARSGDACLTRT
jgi:hypothetical protein